MALVKIRILAMVLSMYCHIRCSTCLETVTCSRSLNEDILINCSVCDIENMTVMPDLEIGYIRIRNLSTTLLQHIQDGCFQNFANLSKLDLQNNRITHLTDKTFKGLTNMKQLDLSFNHFVRLKQGWFEMLNSLEKLLMNNCGIQFFEPAQFAWPDRLFDLSLMNNRIPVMPPLPLATRNDSRWTVHLEGNDIYCKCRREEHTGDLLNLDTFSKLYSRCVSQQYADSEPVQTITTKRTILLWNQYISSPVCDKFSFKTDCDITGICSAEYNISRSLQQETRVYQLHKKPWELIQNEMKGSSGIYLEAGSVFKCNMNVINLSLTTEHNKTIVDSHVTSTVRPTTKNKTSDKIFKKYEPYIYLLCALLSTLILFMVVLTCYFCCTRKCKKEKIQYMENRYVQKHVHMTEPIYEVINETKRKEEKGDKNTKHRSVSRCNEMTGMENKPKFTTKEECQESDLIDDVSDVIDGSDVDSFTYSESTSGSNTDTSGESFDSVNVSSCEKSSSPTEE